MLAGQLTEEERAVSDMARSSCQGELMPRVLLANRNEDNSDAGGFTHICRFGGATRVDTGAVTRTSSPSASSSSMNSRRDL